MVPLLYKSDVVVNVANLRNTGMSLAKTGIPNFDFQLSAMPFTTDETMLEASL